MRVIFLSKKMNKLLTVMSVIFIFLFFLSVIVYFYKNPYGGNLTELLRGNGNIMNFIIEVIYFYLLTFFLSLSIIYLICYRIKNPLLYDVFNSYESISIYKKDFYLAKKGDELIFTDIYYQVKTSWDKLKDFNKLNREAYRYAKSLGLDDKKEFKEVYRVKLNDLLKV